MCVLTAADTGIHALHKRPKPAGIPLTWPPVPWEVRPRPGRKAFLTALLTWIRAPSH